MQKKTITVGDTKLDYFTFGDNPELLIDTGTHGDEYDIIPLVRKALDKNLNGLPSFIYIPEISPSAVALKTRNNNNGLNINRHFFTNSNLDEVKAIKKVIEKYHFDLSVTLHEDLSFTEFYLYDTENLEGYKYFKTFKNNLAKIGVGLYNGYDNAGDPALVNDPVLGWKAVDGNIPFNPAADISEDGQFAAWMVARKHIKRVINPEIPGKLDLEKKQKVIDLIFENIIFGIFG